MTNYKDSLVMRSNCSEICNSCINKNKPIISIVSDHGLIWHPLTLFILLINK